MKYILALLLLIFIGCRSDKWRYFLVTYETSGGNYGNYSFRANGFPAYNEIDSNVFETFPMDRSCYGKLIIYNIYEFKDSVDYNNYREGEISNMHPTKSKEICHE